MAKPLNLTLEPDFTTKSSLSFWDKIRTQKRLIKLLKWEFWPFWVFYVPLYFYWLYLAVRARSLFFFSAANPLMELGGFYKYSKYKVLQHIPAQYLPKTILINSSRQIDQIEVILAQNQLKFPLIAKPDQGERGKQVMKVNHLADLKKYLQKNSQPIIIQEFIDTPLEFGVMYYRFANQKQGTVNSVVQKDFLAVVGDGISTVQTLLEAGYRTNLYYDHIQENYPEMIDLIPKFKEKIILEPIGNHCRGTAFLNANHLINNQLLNIFDRISQQIPGFYFGRYDLKVQSLEDLYSGNIKIVELNGANSEPAHIYDPQMSIWRAYRHLFRHWFILYKVSTLNHQQGIKYADFWASLKQMLKK